jgi:hypothetical protein
MAAAQRDREAVPTPIEDGEFTERTERWFEEGDKLLEEAEPFADEPTEVPGETPRQSPPEPPPLPPPPEPAESAAPRAITKARAGVAVACLVATLALLAWAVV